MRWMIKHHCFSGRTFKSNRHCGQVWLSQTTSLLLTLGISATLDTTSTGHGCDSSSAVSHPAKSIFVHSMIVYDRSMS